MAPSALLFLAALVGAAPPSLPLDGFVGVNIVDLLWSYAGWTMGNASFSRASMRAACAPPRSLTYVRFAALPFWPAQLNTTYLSDEASYWALMDGLVADAAAAGCALMPTLFWQAFAFGDAFGEPGGVVYDAGFGPSRARAAMEKFASDFPTRYRDNAAIVAYELGNENNLLWNLNMTQQQPCVGGPGSPPARTRADNFSTADGVAVNVRLANIVRTADARGRPISSGLAMARPDATWLRESYAAAHPPHLFFDTREQFLATTALEQAGADLMSQHIYAGSDNERFGAATDPFSPAVLAVAAEAAAAAGQTLFVGEFGDSAPGNRTFTRNVLALFDAWRKGGGAAGARFFGCLWSWELLQQRDSYAVFPGRDDAIIDTIVAHDASLL